MEQLSLGMAIVGLMFLGAAIFFVGMLFGRG